MVHKCEEIFCKAYLEIYMGFVKNLFIENKINLDFVNYFVLNVDVFKCYNIRTIKSLNV